MRSREQLVLGEDRNPEMVRAGLNKSPGLPWS